MGLFNTFLQDLHMDFACSVKKASVVCQVSAELPSLSSADSDFAMIETGKPR